MKYLILRQDGRAEQLERQRWKKLSRLAKDRAIAKRKGVVREEPRLSNLFSDGSAVPLAAGLSEVRGCASRTTTDSKKVHEIRRLQAAAWIGRVREHVRLPCQIREEKRLIPTACSDETTRGHEAAGSLMPPEESDELARAVMPESERAQCFQPYVLIIIFIFVVVNFVMRMIAAKETLASGIELCANLSTWPGSGMDIYIGVPRTDGTQQLRKFTSGNSLTSRTNDVCCRDDSFNSPDAGPGQTGVKAGPVPARFEQKKTAIPPFTLCWPK